MAASHTVSLLFQGIYATRGKIVSIKQNMKTVIEALSKAKRDEMGEAWVSAANLAASTKLSPADLNDAVEILVGKGFAKWRQYMGTAPYFFAQATITPNGRLSLE